MTNTVLKREKNVPLAPLLDANVARTVILISDILLINLMYWVSYVIRYSLEFPYPVPAQYETPFGPYIPYGLFLMLLCLLAFNFNALYDSIRRKRRWIDDFYTIINGTATSIVIVMAVTFFLQPPFYSRGMLVLAGVLIIVALGAARLGLKLIQNGLRRRGIGVENVLLVGAGNMGRAVWGTVLADPTLGYQVVGFLDDDPEKATSKLGNTPGLGRISDLKEVLKVNAIDEVMVTIPWDNHRKIMRIVNECNEIGTRVRVVPDVFRQRLSNIDLHSLNGIPLMGGADVSSFTRTDRLIKRFIDYLLCLLVLPILLIVFGIIAILIKLDSPGPVIFKQKRIGKNGRPFRLLKFRSMVVGAEKLQSQMEPENPVDRVYSVKDKNDPRVTRVGKWLRTTSLDELPQLINVLRGEMTLVGPRPNTPDEVAKYHPWQQKRLSALPGITGLWQVSGRSNMTFDEGCLLDIFYIENWSIDLDFRILLQTIPRVLFRDGAY